MPAPRHSYAFPIADSGALPALRWMEEWARWTGAMATVLPLLTASPFFLAPPLWVIALMQARRS